MTLIDLRMPEDIIGAFIEETPKFVKMVRDSQGLGQCTMCGIKVEPLMMLRDKLMQL